MGGGGCNVARGGIITVLYVLRERCAYTVDVGNLVFPFETSTLAGLLITYLLINIFMKIYYSAII